MAAGLVNLERDLAGVEDQRLDATRALGRGEQGDRLFADPLPVPVELQRRDVLVAARSLVPAEGIRIGPVLNLLRRGRRRLDPGTALEELLLGEGAVRRCKDFLLPDELHRAFADGHALHGSHRLIGAQQEFDLLAQRHAERIALDRRSIATPRGNGRPQINRHRAGAGAGPGDPTRAADNLPDLDLLASGTTSETLCTIS